MKASDYIEYDALGLADLIQKKEVSARELCDAALIVHAATDPSISAVIEIWPEEIDEALKHASKNTPFFGVPFMIKDIALTMKGKENEVGSRLAEGMIALNDSELMRRFRKAGVVTIGRTKTPELGLFSTTEPVFSGPASNPWNLAHSTGGSSGGAAAVVAARVTPFAHANDGAGSIRIPSSCCGVFGLKPTRGRISVGPDIDEILCGLGVEFAISRTVRDSAALLDEVYGGAQGDPYEIPSPSISFSDAITRAPDPLKIGLMLHPFDGSRSAPKVVAAVKRAARLCSDLGHEVELLAPELGMSWEAFINLCAPLYCAGSAYWLGAVAAAMARIPDENTLEPPTIACYRFGKELSAVDMMAAFSARNMFTRQFAAFFSSCDIFMCPTLPDLPAPLGHFADWRGDGRDWIARVFAHTPFTPVFNVSGLPAMTVPLAHDDESGLPIGVQFGAAFGEEGRLLQLAAQLESADPWIGRMPDLCKTL